MIGWLKSTFALFFPNWQAMGSHPFYFFDDEGFLMHTMSVTYYTGRFERRKIEFDKGHLNYMTRMDCQPKNHPLYHNLIVPFLRKTGDFDLPNATVGPMIRKFCANIAPVKTKKMFKEFEQQDIKAVSDKAGSNVLPFAPVSKDNNEPPAGL